LPSPGRNGPGVEIRIEQLDDVVNGQHGGGELRCLFLIVEEFAADVGVQPDQVRDGGIVGGSFEGMGHVSHRISLH
jgi:hypothetical protein